LKKFSKDGENSAVYNGLSETDKKTFDALVNKLQEKVNAMEKEANKGNQNPNNNNPEKSWYQKPWGIVGIIAVIALVIGLVAYLIKSNSSEEGEGESE